MTITSDMTKGQAHALRAAHASEARALTRMTRHELAVIERCDLAARDIERIMGGPASKDELIGAILEMRYPAARQNEAVHVLGHDSRGWSACNFCHDGDGTHDGHLCECDRRAETDCQVCGKMAAFHFSSTSQPSGRPVLTDHGHMGHAYVGGFLEQCDGQPGHDGDHFRPQRFKVSYLHLKGYRVSRTFDTREAAQEFIDDHRADWCPTSSGAITNRAEPRPVPESERLHVGGDDVN
jgi:hypothetical protein